MKLVLISMIIALWGCSARQSDSHSVSEFELKFAPGLNSINNVIKISFGSDVVSGRFVDYVFINGQILLSEPARKALWNSKSKIGDIYYVGDSLRVAVVAEYQDLDRPGSFLAADTAAGRDLFSKIKSILSENGELIFMRDASGQMETFASLDGSNVTIIKRRAP
jgi:hypothetical protein